MVNFIFFLDIYNQFCLKSFNPYNKMSTNKIYVIFGESGECSNINYVNNWIQNG